MQGHVGEVGAEAEAATRNLQGAVDTARSVRCEGASAALGRGPNAPCAASAQKLALSAQATVISIKEAQAGFLVWP